MKASESIPSSLILYLLLAGGCNESHDSLGLSDRTHPSSFADVAVAGAPNPIPIFEQFDDVNPCSGLIHTVTFTGTAWIQETDGRTVVREKRTITTSSGFLGRGSDTFVDNGNIQKLTLNDMLTNGSGDRIKAQFIMVFDLSTATVQVLRGGLTCVGQ